MALRLRDWRWSAAPIVIALYLAPLWAFDFLPTQDGPAHLYNASLETSRAAPDGSSLRHYFEPRPEILENKLAHRSLDELMALSRPQVAEKLFATAYVLLFLAGAAYVVTLRRENLLLLGLWLPLIYSYSFHMGFYSFCASVVCYLFVLGYWMRHHAAFALRHAAVLSVLLAVTYLWHPLTFVVAVCTIGCGAFPRALAAWRAGARAELRRAFAGPAVSAAPSVALLASFAGRESVVPAAVLPSPGRVLGQLTSEPDWIAYNAWEAVPFAVLLVAIVATAALIVRQRLRDRRWQRWDGLGLAALGLWALYFVAPDDVLGGGYLHTRLILFGGLASLCWLSAQSFDRRVLQALGAIGLAASLSLLALQWHAYSRLNPLLQEYASAFSAVPPHASLLAVSMADDGDTPDTPGASRRVLPMLHAAGHVGTRRDVALLNNYQADTTHFPVAFRNGVNPYHTIGDIQAFPFEPLDIAAFERASGRTVDAVLVWTGGQDPASHGARGFAGGVPGPDYERVFVSSPRGWAQVWRRRHVTAGAM